MEFSPKSSELSALQQARAEIDFIDRELGTLLSKRIELAKEIQIGKRKHQISNSVDPSREREIISNLQAHHPELPSQLIEQIYESIFSVTRNL